jgi:hypothetical protein
MRDRNSTAHWQGTQPAITRQFEASDLNLDHLANAVKMLLASVENVGESDLLFHGNRASHVVGREQVV